MAAQKQDDQHERTFSSYVRIQVVVLKTCLGRWTIGRSGERGSGISVLPARYDDDDDDDSVNTILMSKKVLFQIIQLSISTQFKYKYCLIVKAFQAIQFAQTIHFNISMLLVLFNPWIWPYQVLPLRARVDLGAMTIKGYSAFPKAPVLLEPHHLIVSYHIQDTRW